MTDAATETTEPNIWPPPPQRLHKPHAPVLTYEVDGIVIAGDGETLTLHSVRSRVKLVILFLIAIGLQLKNSIPLVPTQVHELREYTRVLPVVIWLPYVIIFIGFFGGSPLFMCICAWLAYHRARTHFSFTARRDIGYTGSTANILCPVSDIAFFKIRRDVFFRMSLYSLTFHTTENIPRRSFVDFLSFRKIRPIATFRNEVDAQRVAKEIADFAGVEVQCS